MTILIGYSLPSLLLKAFIICLCLYVSGKNENKKNPNTISPREMRQRKIALVVTSTIFAVLFAIVIGIIVLLSQGIAHM